jgi:hypothetical protein
VTDVPAWQVNTRSEQLWESLSSRGFAVTDDRSLGLRQEFREDFRLAYFSDQMLRHDEGDMPADRKRARDVIRYQWLADELRLREHETITITDRGRIPGKREHKRIELLGDPQAAELIRALLGLVPRQRRQAAGTFGVNLFRTYTNVVTAPHQDDEEFILIYVLDRVGTGAETHLYLQNGDPASGAGRAGPAESALRQRLDPGDILIFEDARFSHETSPLLPPPGGRARRDALICTVDYPTTYQAS